MMSDQPAPDLLRHTASVVAAHVEHNQVAAEMLPALIQSVYQTLAGLGTEPVAAAAARPEPAVPVRKSVFPDYIVCLEDGAKMKMLKRYLQTHFSLTPAAYRERWGLPADYPMVAPSYASRRSALAKQIGLGRKPGVEQAPEVAAAQEQDTSASKPPKSRAPKKAKVTED